MEQKYISASGGYAAETFRNTTNTTLGPLKPQNRFGFDFDKYS